MKYIKKYKIIIIIISLLTIICLSYNKPTLASSDEKLMYNELLEENKKDEIIKVDLKGAVKTPGVYSLKEGDRVIDAVNLAGGLNKNAAVNTINLSKRVSDEMVIIVYTIEEINKMNEPKINKIKIDIKGEVKNPGVYELIESSRLIDAVNLAGGLTDKADVSKINLSTRLSDEMLVNIISIKEIVNDALINSENILNESNVTKKISLNKASKDELMTLSGIGEAKALKIIEYREITPFNDISELKNVSGISETMYEKIKDNITI